MWKCAWSTGSTALTSSALLSLEVCHWVYWASYSPERKRLSREGQTELRGALVLSNEERERERGEKQVRTRWDLSIIQCTAKWLATGTFLLLSSLFFLKVSVKACVQVVWVWWAGRQDGGFTVALMTPLSLKNESEERCQTGLTKETEHEKKGGRTDMVSRRWKKEEETWQLEVSEIRKW